MTHPLMNEQQYQKMKRSNQRKRKVATIVGTIGLYSGLATLTGPYFKFIIGTKLVSKHIYRVHQHKMKVVKTYSFPKKEEQ